MTPKLSIALTERLEAPPSTEHNAHPGDRGIAEVVSMASADRPGSVANHRNIRG